MENVIVTILEKNKEMPDAFAVSDEKSSFTYKELIEYSAMISANMIKAGVKYGDRIIIEISRRKEYVACLLSCWLIGAVCIPLTDDYPLERREYIKKDSRYSLCIDENFIKELDISLSIKPIIPKLEDEGLVIYTSGSTGNPKGVIHTFASMTAVANRNTIHDQAQSVKKNEIFGLIAPFTFIVGMSLTLAALSLGKHIVLVPDEIRKDPFKLAKYYDDNNIQSSFVPPRMVHFMLEHNKSLKVISVGSERITNIFFNDNPVVMNGYGSTETFGGILGFKIDKAYDNTPIGKPFGKEKVYVLDDNNNEVEVGELCIAGEIAKGYLNREEESKKVFVNNPFKDIDGFERMFRTRDIVKKLEDGNLVFVERKDWMIKINGQRVEPLEIESCIRRFKGISSVAVKDFTANNGVTYLVAYFVADSSFKLEGLKKHCKENLTAYMVPTFYIQMKELPVNPNGKLDRKNLPNPDISILKNEYEAPKNKIEKDICDAFETVLKCGKVSRNDDFFLIGGDSIKALEVVNLLEDLPIDLNMLFEGKTAENITKLIDSGGNDEIEFDRSKKDSYPLSSSQLGVYFPCLSNPNSTEYNNPIKICFDKNVDLDKLINAVETSLNNHKAFKCQIKNVDGVPSMVEVDRNIKVVKIITNCVEDELYNFVRPFNLEKDELVRVKLFICELEYVVAFDFHHIVFDGTTLSIILKEISRSYEGKELYEEKTSIFDYSSYELAVKQSEKYQSSKAYYESLFANNDINNDMPIDFDEKGNNSLGNIVNFIKLDNEKLLKFIKSNGISENSFFLSAFAFTLAKFNGNDKALVCCAESGRHTSLTFNTAGMLVKTLALPIDLTNESDIGLYCKHVEDLFKENYKNDAYPFSELANKFSLNNDFSFVYQNNMFSTITIENKPYIVKGLPNKNSISKLSLMAFKNEDEFRFSFSYRADLFYKCIMESFAETFLQVCREFLNKESFKDINLVSERQTKLLKSFNDNKIEVENRSVIDLFYDSVNKFSNKVALVYKNKKYTYKEINLITNRIANYIVSLGLNNDTVSILIPRSEYLLLASFGVIKAGCCYVPLDTTYPNERLSFMVKDSESKLLITTKELENNISSYNGNILYLEDIDDLKNENDVKTNIELDNPFVILYTSGTTGTPKGVMLTHRNISVHIEFEKNYFKLDEHCISAMYASFGFDAGMEYLMTIPCVGGCLHIIDEDIRLNLLELDKYCIDNKITNIVMTTQVGRQFALLTKSDYLKYILVGGEKLVPVNPKECKVALYNGYGPTEATIFVTCQLVDKLYHRIPIGKCIENVSGYVIDKNLSLVPIGVPGELLISGPKVSKGYLNLKEKTDKSFIANPFNADKNYSKAYKTGDIVRYLDDGTIDFIGRNDGQVKIRGFRIELTEIEGVIREYNGIKDATVQAFDSLNGGKYIAAYFVSDKTINLDDLKKFIASKKPPYMVPEAMKQIDKIPLNQNQKVNKKALPIINREKPKVKTPNIHKDNIIVSKIKEAILDILGSNDFDYEDNLFDFGMNSLSIVRLSVLLKEKFNVICDIKELLSNCSICSIENLVISNLLLKDNQNSNSQHIIKDEYSLTSSQVGIYTEYLKDVKSCKYNIPILIKFDKDKYPNISVDILKECLVKIFKAHISLGLTFSSNKDGQFVMIPHYDNEPVIELVNTNSEEYEEIKNNFVQPHDLSKQAYRFKIIKTDNFVSMFIDIHHIIFDGYSQNIFLSDLLKCINKTDIVKEDYSIFDLSIEEENLNKSEKKEAAKQYYVNLLENIEGSTHIEKDVFLKEKIPQTINIKVDKLNVKKLKEFIKENNLTLNSYFLSCFSFTLSRFTYQNNICFSTVYNGRNSIKTNNMIGMTVKTLPFVYNFDENISCKEYLKHCKNQILSSMENDIYSFFEIAKDFDLALDILFVYQGEINKEMPFDISFLALNELKSNISIEVRNDEDNFFIHCEYDSGQYSSDLISSLLNSFINVSNEILIKENINDISLLDEQDIKLLSNINHNEYHYDFVSIGEMFTNMAKQFPDKDCVIYKEKHLTYKEVDEITDRIANYIISLCLKAEDVVAVLVNRNENILLATYGVIKAGCCVQPIDKSYPRERINFMLADSKAKLLISDENLLDIANEYKGNVLLTKEFVKLKKVNAPIKVEVNEHDLMVLLYTSGTTGTPKGVMLEYGNFTAFLHSNEIVRKIDSNSIGAFYASFGFDAAMMELIDFPTKGATLHIIDEEMRLDLPFIEKYYIENKITHPFFTTQIAREFILQTKSPYLKNVLFGGEKIVPFNKENATFECLNCYGPTETTIFSTSYSMKGNYERVPIGKANRNSKVYILDKSSHRLPCYAIGELAIAGRQVSRGYLNRDEKTKSVFIHNSFDDDSYYKTIYKTGDITRISKTGEIDFIGRNDGQVKVRGFRIELTEVEEIVRRFPDIKDATVNAYDDPNGGKFIACFITSEIKIDIKALNQFILNEKPAYMVPRITIQIEHIPITPNGKVDKKKLPIPDLSKLQEDYVAPSNELEKEFCDIFSTILGVNKVSVNDDFFMLGGSSINAAQIVSFAFSKGYDLVYKNVFDNPTPKKLAQFISKQNNFVNETVNDSEVIKHEIEPIFSNNDINQIDDLKSHDIGNILLFGATGFLGSHVLKELLDNTDKKIICVIRENDLQSPKERLMTLLEYYFENPYIEEFDKRIFIVSSDLLDKNIVDKVKEYDFDTIINCAALVKHFANDNSIEETNTGGAINLTNLALLLSKRLVHVSTLSVSGESVNDNIGDDFKFKENMLYIGQSLDNKYIKSKFDAEKEIRDAIESKGLKAKIIRVGNLMSRSNDGEFQINFHTNNFMNTIRAFKLMGCVPFEMLSHSVEFSQIDLVAKAIILLASTNDKFNVFHVNNIHTIQMNNVINELNKNGIKVDKVNQVEFANRLNQLLNSETDVRSINSLLAYRSNRNEKRKMIDTDNSFTLAVLYRLGFAWPLPDNEYLSKLIEYLVSLEFLK